MRGGRDGKQKCVSFGYWIGLDCYGCLLRGWCFRATVTRTYSMSCVSVKRIGMERVKLAEEGVMREFANGQEVEVRAWSNSYHDDSHWKPACYVGPIIQTRNHVIATNGGLSTRIVSDAHIRPVRRSVDEIAADHRLLEVNPFHVHGNITTTREAAIRTFIAEYNINLG